MGKLTGKVAVVTGASKGIGAAVAEHLAREGASVVVNYASSKDGAEAVVARIKKAGGKAIAVQGDVAKATDIERLFAETKKEFGAAHILVNNAGVYKFEPLEHVTEERFHWMFNLNVLGLLMTTKAAVAEMSKGGSIVNISSIAAKSAPPMGSIYSATKAAVDAITGSLAKELGPRGIRVNSINPGMVETEGLTAAGFPPEFRKHMEATTPLGRIAQPDDIADAVVFLASEDSRWVSGETLLVAGGQR